MGRAAGPSINWNELGLERLEQHLADLKAVGKSPTSAFMSTLRRKRAEALRQPVLFRPSWSETKMQGHEAAGSWNAMPFERARDLLFSEITRNLGRWSDDTSRAEYQRVLHEVADLTEERAGRGISWRPRFGHHEFTIERTS